MQRDDKDKKRMDVVPHYDPPDPPYPLAGNEAMVYIISQCIPDSCATKTEAERRMAAAIIHSSLNKNEK